MSLPNHQNCKVINIEEARTSLRLSRALLEAAQCGDANRIERLLADGAPVNPQDPSTGATPLHYAAAFRARPAFRTLLKSGKCDFLIRDRKGRLAWELASNTDDSAMTRLLIRRTAKQAEAQGLPLPPRREPAHR